MRLDEVRAWSEVVRRSEEGIDIVDAPSLSGFFQTLASRWQLWLQQAGTKPHLRASLGQSRHLPAHVVLPLENVCIML